METIGVAEKTWAEQIREYMEKHDIPSIAAFARRAGVSETTVKDTLSGKHSPKRKGIIAKLEQALTSEDQITLPAVPVVSCQKFAPRPEILIAGEKISGLTPWLYWLIFLANEKDRWQLRELLGAQFQDFLVLVRALNNERMRSKVIEEEGSRFQKGRTDDYDNT